MKEAKLFAKIKENGHLIVNKNSDINGNPIKFTIYF